MLRKPFLLTALFTLLLTSLLQLPGRSTYATSPATIHAAELTWDGANFPPGTATDLTMTAAGLTLTGEATTGRYQSPPLTTPLPFNALVPDWQAGLPAGTQLTLTVRTAPAAGAWSPWLVLPQSEDMTLPDANRAVAEMLTVPAADRLHHRLQFAVQLTRPPDAAPPLLRALRLTLIDATAGPDAPELAAGARPLQEGNNYPKPPVINRASWCTDPACNYDPGQLSYHPVSHLIVHHTATSNEPGNSADTVRAIWYYHTIVLGWGDLGYHYLVDRDGYIFEGHAGGDDVIGVHAGVANTGSLGVAMLGNFVPEPPGIDPPPAMLNSVADLLAWKADQKSIDIFDSSRLPNMAWGLTHLTGHRDVAGSTLCPGDRAHDLLPALRDDVAGRLGFTPPHLYYDELNPAANFQPNAAPWNEGPLGCGFDTHAFYALSTPGGMTHWAEWRPNVPASGRYELSVYAPFCVTGLPDTQGARYEVTHANGTAVVTVNQEANLGLWMPLGEFYFNAGTSGRIFLSNQTTTESGAGVWFDALRLRYLGPTATNLAPPAGAWLTTRTVTFQWQVSDPGSVASQYVEVATDPAFTNLIHTSPPLAPPAASYTHDFTADYATLYWRVRLIDTAGSVGYSPATSFGIDTVPPVSAVQQLFRLSNGSYLVRWQGSDALSGVASYNVEYRAAGDGNWTPWLANTANTTAVFNPPAPQTIYWFRSQARDTAGNLEPPHPLPGDAHTDQAHPLDYAIMLPIIWR